MTSPLDELASAAVATSAKRPPCPVCGSQLPPLKKRKGSNLVFVILMLIGVVPGVIYALVMNGFDYVCPKCGTKRGQTQ